MAVERRPKDYGDFEEGNPPVIWNQAKVDVTVQGYFDELGGPTYIQGDFFESFSSSSSSSSSSSTSFSSSSTSSSSTSSSSSSSTSSSSSSTSSSSSSTSSSSSSSSSYPPVWVDNARVEPPRFPSGTRICAEYDYHGYWPESGSLIRWYQNDVYLPRYDDTKCFIATGEVGDVFFFTVTPSDGYRYGDTARSTPGIIIAVVAEVPTVEIVPHNPQITDNLYVVLDGRVRLTISRRYRVTWYKNGSIMPAYQDKYYVPYTEVSEGDVFTVEAEYRS